MHFGASSYIGFDKIRGKKGLNEKSRTCLSLKG